MTIPRLDYRNKSQIYQQLLVLANAYCPQWSDYWPENIDEDEVADDPGLILFKLFSILMEHTINMENSIPLQRRLAFFQFMGISPRPPLAATAALSFSLKKAKEPVLVEQHSTVSSKQYSDVVFQTENDLSVVPAELSSAFTIIPEQDLFINVLALIKQNISAPVFVNDCENTIEQNALGHWFIIGGKTLFKPDSSLQSITINIHGKQLYAEYFSRWFDGDLTSLSTQVTADSSGESLSVTLTSLPQADAQSIDSLSEKICMYDGNISGSEALPVTQKSNDNQQQEFWLTVRPATGIKILELFEQQLPVITSLNCELSGRLIQADKSVTNNVLVDIGNGAYPFGETPKVDDAFYICCDSVFSRVGARVILNFDLTALQEQYPVTLNWQFWDGKEWSSLNGSSVDVSRYDFVDNLNNFWGNNANGPTGINFICPVLQKHKVAGEQGLWIRVVIEDGGYGEEGGFITTSVANTLQSVPTTIISDEQREKLTSYLNNKEGINFSYKFNRSRFYPPFIKSMNITYNYQLVPESFFSYNAFELSRFLYHPYKPVESDCSSFYLGFEAIDFQRFTVGNKLTLYFYLQQNMLNDCVGDQLPANNLAWQYYDGKVWESLQVDDSTHQFCVSGIVSFIVPIEIKQATLFSHSAVWLRVCNSTPTHNIRIFGVYPNSVMSSNKHIVHGETLGSSNEMPEQEFILNFSPVLAGLELMVREPVGLDEVQGDAHHKINAQGKTSGTKINNDEKILRKWHEVEHFAFSGPTDRVFLLNHQTGKITFGDGRNGLIPPQGHNNIIATEYGYTDGIDGNLHSQEINILQPGVNNIASVTNPSPASGGVGGDNVSWINRYAPAIIKTSNRAVELSDFIPLALASTPQVDKAVAIQAEQKQIALYILMISEDARPQPDLALLSEVKKYISERCVASLVNLISVKPPDFVDVNVTVQLTTSVPVQERNPLEQKVADDLEGFLQPVFGGPNNLGWKFGDIIKVSQLNQYCQSITSVTNVLSITINGLQNNTDLVLQDNQLPVAGKMTVYALSESS